MASPRKGDFSLENMGKPWGKARFHHENAGLHQLGIKHECFKFLKHDCENTGFSKWMWGSRLFFWNLGKFDGLVCYAVWYSIYLLVPIGVCRKSSIHQLVGLDPSGFFKRTRFWRSWSILPRLDTTNPEMKALCSKLVVQPKLIGISNSETSWPFL